MLLRTDIYRKQSLGVPGSYTSARLFTSILNVECESSLRKQPFRLALRRWGRFARRNVCDSATEIRYCDDVNQCLHNISGSHGVPHPNLFSFTFLLVDFTKVLCSSANELQQNVNASSRGEYISQILTILLEIHRFYI